MGWLNIALPTQESQTGKNLRRWEELLNDPGLARFEGRIERMEIGHLLRTLMRQGWTITECPISTADGNMQFLVSPALPAEAASRLCPQFPARIDLSD
jgi:hypothetical protein